MIAAYYNEHDPKAAAWLRQLIKNGNITPGEVDERSITYVKPDDLIGFDRCHFFAGIGTWDYCLNESGWWDRPIWTASLPCQPFSAAGKGLGKADERHLLPHFLELVKECRPTTIIGEQVAAAIGHGWLDDLYTEMEACDYAIGSAVIGAHSVNSPHIRQRLYWLADSTFATRIRPEQGSNCESHGGEFVSGMADSDIKGSQGREGIECTNQFIVGQNGMVDGMGNSEHEQHKRSLSGCGEESTQDRKRAASEFAGSGEVEWIYCRDGKTRPIKSGIQPLAHGLTRGMGYSGDPGAPIDANNTQEARTMRLKGYGNAIQAQTAIAFISAYIGSDYESTRKNT